MFNKIFREFKMRIINHSTVLAMKAVGQSDVLKIEHEGEFDLKLLNE